MLIDCDTCAMRDTSACDDCLVSVLLVDGPLDVSDEEHRAFNNLAEAGLAPPLRLVPRHPPRSAAS